MINRYIIKKEYNLHDIDEIDIKGECVNIMWRKVLIKETENPISAFEEALYVIFRYSKIEKIRNIL